MQTDSSKFTLPDFSLPKPGHSLAPSTHSPRQRIRPRIDNFKKRSCENEGRIDAPGLYALYPRLSHLCFLIPGERPIPRSQYKQYIRHRFGRTSRVSNQICQVGVFLLTSILSSSLTITHLTVVSRYKSAYMLIYGSTITAWLTHAQEALSV